MPPNAKTKRRKARRGTGVPNLAQRAGIFYYVRQHDRIGRISKSLETDDITRALERHGAINAIIDRGDYDVIRRWLAGDVDAAELARAVREGEVGELRIPDAASPRLGPTADAFLRRTRATLSPRSHEAYTTIFRQLRDAWGDGAVMASATTEQAERFLHAPKFGDGRPWSPRSQSSYRTMYKALWAFAIERDTEDAERAGHPPTITRNPWRKARTPKQRRTRHSFLLPEEARAMLAHPAIHGTPDEAFLATAVYAGLRRGELRHLRPVDLFLDEPEPFIRVVDRDGEHAWRTKTENSNRDVPITPTLVEILRRHLERFAGDRYVFRVAGRDRPMSEGAVRLLVRRAFQAVGLKYGREGEALTLHSLRHTCATWLVSAGIPIPTVAKWLGDTPEVVLSTYAHHMPKDDDRARAVIESAAGGGK